MFKEETEQLIAKAGGRYRLCILVQRRVKELKHGFPRLVKRKTTDLLEVVAEEVLVGKVRIVGPEDERFAALPDSNLQIRQFDSHVSGPG